MRFPYAAFVIFIKATSTSVDAAAVGRFLNIYQSRGRKGFDYVNKNSRTRKKPRRSFFF